MNKIILDLKKKITYRSMFFMIIAILFIGAFSIPIIRMGISNRDEMLYRHLSIGGARDFWNYMMKHSATQGRVANMLFAIPLQLLTFIGHNHVVYKSIVVFSVLVNQFLFGYLVYKITNNSFVPLFSAIIFFLVLPINFGTSPPVAHTAIVSYPFTLFLIACILYLKCFDSLNFIERLVIYFLFLYSLFTYEIFILFFPLFILLAIFKTKSKISIKLLIKKVSTPFLSCISYLIIYMVIRILYPTHYTGTSVVLDFQKISSTFRAIVYSIIPGWQFKNEKLDYIYHNWPEQFLNNSFLGYVITPRIVLYLVLSIIICMFVIKLCLKDQSQTNSTSLYVVIMLFSLYGFISIPMLLSLTQKFQNNTEFAGYAASYISYFFSSLIISIVVYLIIRSIRLKGIVYVVVFSLVLLTYPTQSMNEVLSKENAKTNQSLTNIEDFFKTDKVQILADNTVYAYDLLKNYGSLRAVPADWTYFSRINGIENVAFTNEINGTETYAIYFYPKDQIVLLLAIDHFESDLVYADDLMLFSSKKRLPQLNIVSGNEYVSLAFDSYTIDHNYYLYMVTLEQPILLEEIMIPLS